MKVIKYIVIAIAVGTMAGCDAWKDAKDLEGSDRSKNLYELLSANPDVSTFVKALDATGYAKKLSEDICYTVFAPDNNALTGLNMTDTAALTDLVQNCISEKIAYANANGAFDISSIPMLSGKNISINGNQIEGVAVSKWNIASKNGVLHIIDGAIENRMNIWQYLQTLQNDPTVKFITSFSEKVMDMSRSVKTGVDGNGQPIYDTIWIDRNSFLDASPLANEAATSTFLLLDQSGLDALKAKYAKYFVENDNVQMENDIMKEITFDMILRYQKINADGRYLNNSGILVDVKASDIAQSYVASNGIVYRVTAADVKMYQNKIQPLTIEAENYIDRWPDAWQTRPRSWASHGLDVALKSRTRNSYDYDTPSTYEDTLKSITGADSIVLRDTIITIKFDTIYRLGYATGRNNGESEWPTPNPLGEPNAYISYMPRMYSTDYKIIWKAYDDNSMAVHIDSRGVPMFFYQKMYISFPGETPLERNASNVITGNFSPNTIMAASMTSGENVETQLVRYSVDNANTIFPNSYVLVQPTSTEDAYGKEGILKCPTFGVATLFVSNTTISGFTHYDGTTQAYLQSSKTANAPGMIFLDYIRLEPQVDPND